MAVEFDVGDRVMYKDIGGERNLKGIVSEVVKDLQGNIKGYTVKLDDGSILGCSTGELIKLPDK